MQEEDKKQNNPENSSDNKKEEEKSKKPFEKGGEFPRHGSRRKKFDRFKKEGRVKPEFDQKIIDIRRVARVVSGGRRFSFSVALVAGNRKGKVGVGLGKATDTALAIEKAFRDAQKNSITVALNKNSSIPHGVQGKASSSIVTMMPAPGRGVLAGSSVRDVLELGGIKDINVKILSRSKNKLNNAKAAIKALSKITK